MALLNISLCGGSASYPRTAALVWYPDTNVTTKVSNSGTSASEDAKMKPFNTSCDNNMNTL